MYTLVSFFVTFIIGSQVYAESPTKLIFQYKEGSGLSYQIPRNRIVVNYTARLIERDFSIGYVIRPKGKNIKTDDIAWIFQQAVVESNENLENIKVTSEEVLKAEKTNEGGASSGTTVLPVAPEEPVLVLDWEKYLECATKSVSLLKKAILFKEKFSSNIEQNQAYLSIKERLASKTSVNGLVCGHFLGKQNSLRIQGDLRNLKVITVMLSRSIEDRERILKVMMGAFSDKLSTDAQILFTYYFMRLTWLAVTTSQDILSFEELNAELIARPESTEESWVIDGQIQKSKNIYQIKNLDELLRAGLKIIEKEKL